MMTLRETMMYLVWYRTLWWFVWNDDAKTPCVRVVVVSRPLVLANQQVLRRCGGGSLVTVPGVRWLGRVVRTSLDDLLDVFWLDVDRHCTDDTAWRWTRCRLEPYWTRVRHTHVQLPQRFRILHNTHSHLTVAF